MNTDRISDRITNKCTAPTQEAVEEAIAPDGSKTPTGSFRDIGRLPALTLHLARELEGPSDPSS
jgi:hypothetical protein